MEVAENKAVMQGDYVEPSFDFYNAKNLSNSAPNETTETQKDQEDYVISAQPIRYRGPNPFGEIKRNMVQQEEPSYQQDQDQETETSREEESLHVTDTVEVFTAPGRRELLSNFAFVYFQGPEEDGADDEQETLASQIPPEDKRKLPLYPNPRFYNFQVNTNYSAVHVPSNVYERCTYSLSLTFLSKQVDATFKTIDSN